jgi:hypothetical protein
VANLPKKALPIVVYLKDGFIVQRPFHYAGILELPPISVPIPKGEHPLPTIPPSPPELPAQERVSSHPFLQ